MKFLIPESKKIIDITARDWQGAGYGPDYFSDLEINAPRQFPQTDSHMYICTQTEIENIISFWERYFNSESDAAESQLFIHEYDADIVDLESAISVKKS